MNLLISTAAFSSMPGYAAARHLSNLGFGGVELSGGQFSSSAKEDLFKLELQVPVFLHNYFPPPQKSFVFNLSSSNKEVLNLSRKHVERALAISEKIGANTFSFHSGFLFDPMPSQLGKRISKSQLIEREMALETFIENVQILSKTANNRGIKLLIENNVLSKENLDEFGTNPFLLVEEDEIQFVLDELAGDAELLLDVAHLKVSGTSLGFDYSECHKNLSQRVAGYHLSENDGQKDSHDAFGKDSWFWIDLNKNANYFSIEVHSTNTDILKEQEALARQQIETIL